MRLEADPTIIYGASAGKGTLGRPILRSELDNEDNPYNTYRNYGLPPTPIANPGRAAIEAVLKPPRLWISFLSPMVQAGTHLRKPTPSISETS